MRIEELREYTVFAKHLCFSSAAKELYLAQSTLSTHISKLEKELGFELVSREQPLSLTPAGELFYEKTRLILEQYDEALFQCIALIENEPVRVRKIPYSTTDFTLLKKVQGTPFVMVSSPVEQSPIDDVTQGKVDIALDFDPTVDPASLEQLKAKGLDFIPVGFGKLDINVMKSNPLASKSALTREDLRNATVFILGSWRASLWSALVESTLGHDLNLHFEIQPSGSVANLSFSTWGNMLGIAYDDLGENFLQERDDIVTFREVDGQPITYALYAIYRKDNDNQNVHELISQLESAN